jgi:hypothetical protein
MLKGLAILTVLLTVSQATMPATGKTANHPTSAGDSSQHNSDADKKPAAQSPSAGQSSQPTREQYDGSTEAGKDNPQPVTIRELPSVSVTKDWTDKSYWLFSGLLVIIGGLQWIETYKGASSHRIFLLGTIWYRDDLDIPRQTGLHRSYDPKTKLFTPQKDSEEEYSD